MNAFPLIFARERKQTELSLIRHSFNSNPSWVANTPKAAPTALTPKASKAVKLKRPSTTRHLTLKPATPTAAESTHSVPRPSNLFSSLNHSSPTSTFVPRRSDLSSFLIPRSATIRVSTHISKRISKQTILNLQTNPYMNSKSSKAVHRSRDCLSRSLSVKGNSRRSSDSLTLSFADLTLAHQIDAEPTIDLKEGKAALPNPLSHSINFEKVFGRPLKHKEKREALKAFLTNSLRIDMSNASHVSIAYRPSTNEISVIITGDKAPLSVCCGSAVTFSFSEASGGKVMCTASYCPSRTISNFHIPPDLRTALWSPDQCRKKHDFRMRKNDRKPEIGAGLFTNEKLKHVSPSRGEYSSIGKVSVLLQIPSITPGPGPSHISATPLQQILKRGNSRHNTVRAKETTAEVLQQLSTLLKSD